MKAFVQRFFSPLVWSGIVSAALISVNPIAVHADSDDPPSRVARLGSLEGTVSIQPAGVNEWSTASSNYPVSTGDRVYTDDNARAELQIGQTVARMWKDTDLSVTNLSDNMTQLGLGARIAEAEDVRHGSADSDRSRHSQRSAPGYAAGRLPRGRL